MNTVMKLRAPQKADNFLAELTLASQGLLHRVTRLMWLKIGITGGLLWTQ